MWSTSPILLVSWVFWVICSITLHELSHGWAAIRCGDRTPIETGHMTWNPIVHMGPTSLIMFAVTGITWGAMPINPARFRGRYDEAKVAFAGPAMNLLLATLCTLAFGLWIGTAGGRWFSGVSANQVLYHNVQIFLRVGVMLNIMLFLFNLLPVPPLDGSRVLSSIHPGYRRMLEGPNAGQIALGLFVVLFLFGGKYIFRAASEATDVATHAIVSVLAPGPRP
jgi:Zn-dependent protease